MSCWLTLIFDLQEVFCTEVLIWCVAPQVFAHYLVQLLSKGFSQAVSQCLHHDVVVVITLSGNAIIAHRHSSVAAAADDHEPQRKHRHACKKNRLVSAILPLQGQAFQCFCQAHHRSCHLLGLDVNCSFSDSLSTCLSPGVRYMHSCIAFCMASCFGMSTMHQH